jgi:cell division septation protein DedD
VSVCSAVSVALDDAVVLGVLVRGVAQRVDGLADPHPSGQVDQRDERDQRQLPLQQQRRPDGAEERHRHDGVDQQRSGNEVTECVYR